MSQNLNVQNLTIISSVDTLHYTHSQFQTATQGVAVVMYLGHETQPAPSVSCRMKINNIVLATTRALRSLVWVTEVPQTAHSHIKHTHLHTSHTHKWTHTHTKQCHIYTWIHSHCTYKHDVPSTHTNALHLHANTRTPQAEQFSYLPVYISSFGPKCSFCGFHPQQSSCHRLPSRPLRHMISWGICVESRFVALCLDSFWSLSDHRQKWSFYV